MAAGATGKTDSRERGGDFIFIFIGCGCCAGSCCAGSGFGSARSPDPQKAARGSRFHPDCNLPANSGGGLWRPLAHSKSFPPLPSVLGIHCVFPLLQTRGDFGGDKSVDTEGVLVLPVFPEGYPVLLTVVVVPGNMPLLLSLSAQGKMDVDIKTRPKTFSIFKRYYYKIEY